jgi:hypothetical protein
MHDEHTHTEREPPRAAARGMGSIREQHTDQHPKNNEKSIIHTHWVRPMYNRCKYTECKQTTGGDSSPGTVARRTDIPCLQHTHRHPNNSKKSTTYIYKHKLVLGESRYKANKRTRSANAPPPATAARTGNILKQHAVLRPCNKEKNVTCTQRDTPIHSNHKQTGRERATDRDARLRAAARATRETKIQKTKLPQKQRVNRTYITVTTSNRKKNHIQKRKTNRKWPDKQNTTQTRQKQHNSRTNSIYMFIMIHNTIWWGRLEKTMNTKKAKYFSPLKNTFAKPPKPLCSSTYITRTLTIQRHQTGNRMPQNATGRIQQRHPQQANHGYMREVYTHENPHTKKAWRRLEQNATAVVLTRLTKQKKDARRGKTVPNIETVAHLEINHTPKLTLIWPTCRTVNQPNPQCRRNRNKQTNRLGKNVATEVLIPSKRYSHPTNTHHLYTTHRRAPPPATCRQDKATRMRPARKTDNVSAIADGTQITTIGNNNTNIDTYTLTSANSIQTTLADPTVNNKQNAPHRINESPAWRHNTESDSKTQHRPMGTENQQWKTNLTHQDATVTRAESLLGITASRQRQSHNTGSYTLIHEHHPPCIHESTGHQPECNRSA